LHPNSFQLTKGFHKSIEKNEVLTIFSGQLFRKVRRQMKAQSNQFRETIKIWGNCIGGKSEYGLMKLGKNKFKNSL
jgi:hypothetical protein